MKKIIIVVIALLILSFRQEKKYAFVFTENQLNTLWNCIDNSNASHAQVKEIEAVIQKQLQDQLPKPPITDSTKKK